MVKHVYKRKTKRLPVHIIEKREIKLIVQVFKRVTCFFFGQVSVEKQYLPWRERCTGTCQNWVRFPRPYGRPAGPWECGRPSLWVCSCRPPGRGSRSWRPSRSSDAERAPAWHSLPGSARTPALVDTVYSYMASWPTLEKQRNTWLCICMMWTSQ